MGVTSDPAALPFQHYEALINHLVCSFKSCKIDYIYVGVMANPAALPVEDSKVLINHLVCSSREDMSLGAFVFP